MSNLEVRKDPASDGWLVLDHDTKMGYGFITERSADNAAFGWDKRSYLFVGSEGRYTRCMEN